MYTCTFYITESSSDKVISSNDGPKENAVWPFQSVKEKTLDEEANLPSPQIDDVTGIYCLVSASFVNSVKLKATKFNCKILNNY